MKKATTLSRRAATMPRESGAAIDLLLFEAGDCLMAVPASEAAALRARDVERQNPGDEQGIDLGEYFGATPSHGPWLQWRRDECNARLRVDRIVEVASCALRTLAPMPAPLRAAGRSSAFWALGLWDGEVFLVLDPARLAERLVA